MMQYPKVMDILSYFRIDHDYGILSYPFFPGKTIIYDVQLFIFCGV